jgi:tripartite-type tricarboxylate transporter receptor subunit TctC
MGGSGGLQAANYMFNIAEKDGTAIGAMENNIPTAPILLPENAKFDAAAFGWIGSITSDPFIGIVWHESKMQKYEDAKTQQFLMGAPAARSFSAQMPSISNDLFGTKFKLIIGYGGSDAVKLAMERGEIDGTFGNAYSSLKVQAPAWITEKKVRIVMQFGLKKHPDLQDVPLFIDQAKTEADKEMLQLLLSPQEFARTYLVPPGVPAERLTVLRRSFDATLKDPKYLEAMKKANLEVANPMTGEELQPLVAQVAKTPAEVAKRTKEILDKISASPAEKK